MDWLEVLKEKCAEKGSKTVAEELGYAPSSIRLVLCGKFRPSADKILAKVAEVYGDIVVCPFNDARRKACMCALAKKLDKPPEDSRKLFRYWKTCRACLAKQTTKERSDKKTSTKIGEVAKTLESMADNAKSFGMAKRLKALQNEVRTIEQGEKQL